MAEQSKCLQLWLSCALFGAAAWLCSNAVQAQSGPTPNPPPSAAGSGSQTVQAPTPPPTAEPAVAPVELQPLAAPATSVLVTPPPPPELQPTPDDERALATKKGPCLLRDICFGPILTFGVLDVLGAGIQVRSNYWGVGFDYQFISFTAQRIPITLSLLTFEGRVYPFAGAFFLAAGIAWQHAGLSGDVTYSDNNGDVTAQARGKINIPVLKLGIGFMGRSGLVLGIDLAFGIQLGGRTVEFSTSLPRVQEVIAVEDKIRQRADDWVGALPFLLQLNLIRIGYLF